MTAYPVAEKVRMGKEWLEGCPKEPATPPADGLLGWRSDGFYMCSHCAGRMVTRGVDFAKIANTPIWADTWKRSCECDLCGLVSLPDVVDLTLPSFSEITADMPPGNATDPGYDLEPPLANRFYSYAPANDFDQSVHNVAVCFMNAVQVTNDDRSHASCVDMLSVSRDLIEALKEALSK